MYECDCPSSNGMECENHDPSFYVSKRCNVQRTKDVKRSSLICKKLLESTRESGVNGGQPTRVIRCITNLQSRLVHYQMGNKTGELGQLYQILTQSEELQMFYGYSREPGFMSDLSIIKGKEE